MPLIFLPHTIALILRQPNPTKSLHGDTMVPVWHPLNLMEEFWNVGVSSGAQDKHLLPSLVNLDLCQQSHWCKSILTSEGGMDLGMGLEFNGCCCQIHSFFMFSLLSNPTTDSCVILVVMFRHELIYLCVCFPCVWIPHTGMCLVCRGLHSVLYLVVVEAITKVSS